MADPELLKRTIIEQLSKVIDPETGVDVIHMRLIEDLSVDETGRATYTFRPSSPLCPIAVPLANIIQKAVAEVNGVTAQEVKVTGYILSNELMEWLNQALREMKSRKAEL